MGDTPSHHSHNGAQSAPPPPPPPPMSSVNIAVQPDADEKPVSFDDLPSDCHLMGSTTKSRVSNLPSRRRPTGKGRGSGDPGVSNGHHPPPPAAQADGASAASGKCEQATAAANTTATASAAAQEQTNKLTDRLALPAGNESEEYDGDESELSRSVVKRGRRSIKKKQPPKGGVALFGGADLFGKGKNPFAHRQRDDSDEKEAERSRSIEPADDKTNDEITVVESQSAMEQRLAKVEREKRETVKREEHDKKPDVVLRKVEKKVEEKKGGDEKGSDSPDSSTKVWEVKEDQKAAAVQRLLMKKAKEAKEKEAKEAEEKKRKEEEKKKRVGGDVQADREKKKREEEAAKRKLAEEKEKQRLEEEAAQWRKEEEALKRSQEE